MKPHLAAQLAVLEEMYDSLVELLRPLDQDCLNWLPLPADTNSIAQMVSHLTGATNGWLARAVGESLTRDRDAEFRVRESADALVASVEQARLEARRRFALLDSVDLGTTRVVRRLSSNREATVSIAWCIEHTLIHAGEHWGQIQLTKQLYAPSP